MSDSLTRAEPVSSEPFAAQGVTITLAPPMARLSLRARDRATLEDLLGRKLPAKIGATAGEIACLGPDEWLLRSAQGAAIPLGEGLPLAVTEISERAVCLIVEGPRAAEVLMAGCPLDLELFASGRATRTIFETVEIILIRSGENRFEVEVWRSFAPWLQLALTTAAAQLR
ncbi:MAG: sarcosine oxidase subunit gamma family protein [Novosphingobium sp.]|nr:sarcosine oxidase subunit gamma family protein [Novosphingobium sp.]